MTYDDPRALVARLEPFYRLLSPQLHEPNVHEASEDTQHYKPGPLLPGNTAAFNLLSDIDVGVRAHHQLIREDIGWPQRPYGGSDRVTIALLRSLPYIVETASARVANRVRHDLVRWVATAEIILGIRNRWAPLPRVTCPVCDGDNVRWRTTEDRRLGGNKMQVRCFPPKSGGDDGPHCVDPSTGGPWHVEVSSLELLRWQEAS